MHWVMFCPLVRQAAEAFFGANRWDTAEVADKDKFNKLMVRLWAESSSFLADSGGGAASAEPSSFEHCWRRSSPGGLFVLCRA